MVAIESDESSEDADASTDEDTHIPATDGQESTPHLPEIQQTTQHSSQDVRSAIAQEPTRSTSQNPTRSTSQIPTRSTSQNPTRSTSQPTMNQEYRAAPIAQVPSRSTSQLQPIQEYRDAPIAQVPSRSTSNQDYAGQMRSASPSNVESQSTFRRSHSTDHQPLRSTSSYRPLRSASSQPDIPSDTTYVKQAGIPPTYVSDNNNNSDDEIRFRYRRRRDDDREQSPIPPEDIAQSLLETINLQNWVLEQDKIEQRVVEASNRRHSNEHPTESTPSIISDIVAFTSPKPDPLTGAS